MFDTLVFEVFTSLELLSKSPLSFSLGVYTQVIEFSQALTESPPSPQLWGNKNFQSPPDLGDLGGKIDVNADT